MKTQKQMNPLEKRSRKIVEEVLKPICNYCKENGIALSIYADGTYQQIGGQPYLANLDENKLMTGSKSSLVQEVLRLRNKLKLQHEDELKFLKKVRKVFNAIQDEYSKKDF